MYQAFAAGGGAAGGGDPLRRQAVKVLLAAPQNAVFFHQVILVFGKQQLPVVQVGNGIGDLFQVGGNVAAQQHAVALILDKIKQDIQNLAAGGGVQPGGGFVQHQQPRPVGQSAGKVQLHPHAAAEFFDALFRR